VDRLADDHANAQRLAEGIRQISELELMPEQVDTNIVIFRLDPAWGTAAQLVASLAARGLLLNAMGPDTLRAVTSLEVDGDDVDRAVEILKEAIRAEAG
jgi:threonine aldolase